ncbi:MAG: hypothetical protein K6E91_15085 [Butyrivibrio sp.]|nr:hypothetical protein [Butyrivibrio sp.]
MGKSSVRLIAGTLSALLLAGCGNAAGSQPGGAFKSGSQVTEGSAAPGDGTATASAGNTALAASQQNATSSKPAAEIHGSQDVPLYICSPDDDMEMTLFFFDEDDSVPYVNAQTIKDLLELTFDGDPGYTITINQVSGKQAIEFTRESGYSMTVDCDADQLKFLDYNRFLAPSTQESVLSLMGDYGDMDSDDNLSLIYKLDSSYDRYGSEVVLDTGKYGIYLYYLDDTCFVPLQTIADFIFSEAYLLCRYNGESVIIDNAMDGTSEELTEMYYSVDTAKRSRSLSEFTYHEICMALDHLYGLKESHEINNFDDFFENTGLKYRLLDQDPEVAADAIYELINLHLDDLHSVYMGNSCYFGKESELSDEATYKVGLAEARYEAEEDKYKTACKKYYPKDRPGYEEVGNTAYISFDSFEASSDDLDYYYKNEPKNDPSDTVDLMLYAYKQITRKDSPVENVVLDLSINGGGSSDSACFVIGMLLGVGTITYEDTFTGANTTELFMVDANADTNFDDNDLLMSDYNLYCLISPLSFSCGNLVPSALKNSHMVTMLGRTSGGGACMVYPMTLADGTAITISGNYRLTYKQNGSIYDVDKGVDPDYVINSPYHFYDRKRLTDFINGLY